MQTKLIKNGYREIFNNSLAPMLIVDIDAPHYTMLDVNNAYLSATNTTREALIGNPVFGVFPANPTDSVSKNIERTIYSFEQAIQNKVPHVMSNYRYDIPVPGTDEFEERYWTTSNTPVLDENGDVTYFIHSPINVTELYKLSEREKQGVEALKQQQQQLYSTFMQAPVGIAIFKGPSYIVDLINLPLCELYNKTTEEMIGKPVFEVLNHAKGLGFEELLDNVRLTGETFKGIALPAPLLRNGKVETVYLNFVYEPFRESDGSISGVIAVATEVTEQVVAKNLLEEAEQRARLAAEGGGLGTYELNLLTGELVSSIKLANIFGYDRPVTRPELIESYHPEDIVILQKAHEQMPSTGKLEYECRIIYKKDNSIRWIKVEGQVFYNSENKPVRIMGVLMDNTARHNAAEEQRKLISLVENTVDLMSILSMEGVNSYINDAGIKLLGFDDWHEATTTPIAQLHTPEHFAQVEKEVLPAVMNTGRWAGTMLVRHLKTGEIFPVFNNCFRIDDPISGKPMAVGAVMRDLRPELAAKKALEDSEQLLRNITTATPTTLWMSDECGAITYINQTWIDWTGLPFDEHLGDGWGKVIYEEDRKKVQDRFSYDLENRLYYETEFRIYHADGTLHWCIVSGQPQYDSEHNFTGYIGACIDITEQKSLEQQKDEFIAIASHELKTPVTSIKGYTQILEQMLQQKGQTEAAGMMVRMNTQIDRLTSLIGDLLDVTKINSGKLQFNETDFDLLSVVKEFTEDMQRTTTQHLLEENHTAGAKVFADRDRIGQVITNLISNAIKYSPASKKIIVSTAVEKNNIIFSVHDFGIGIPEDKLGKVFEQFYRVTGDQQYTFPGLGLGLYISSEIIKRSGGKIWVTSKYGEGSTFSFSLPVNG